MKKSKHTASSLCPCGSGKTYEDCCGRYHAGTPAPDARSLMASRYSAYALGLEKYVRDTWCEEKCPADLDLKTNPITWLGLEIRSFRETGPDTAEVEYVARGRSGGAGAFRLHELSRFVKREGRWLYLDGDCFEK